MAVTPQVRTGLTHVGTALGGAVAALSFASSHSVDLYAIFNQINVIVAEIGKLIAIATPFITGAYGIYKSSTKNNIQDVVNDPKAPEVARGMPATPESVAVANALKT